LPSRRGLSFRASFQRRASFIAITQDAAACLAPGEVVTLPSVGAPPSRIPEDHLARTTRQARNILEQHSRRGGSPAKTSCKIVHESHPTRFEDMDIEPRAGFTANTPIGKSVEVQCRWKLTARGNPRQEPSQPATHRWQAGTPRAPNEINRPTESPRTG
jgi:hypothetical protein